MRESRKFPLIRIIIVFTLIVVAYTNGWFHKLVDMLPLPGNEEPAPPAVEDWIAGCTSYDGTPFELKNDYAQCSWIVTDSLMLPNTFLRYVAPRFTGWHPRKILGMRFWLCLKILHGMSFCT